jgi:hypothetical protein
VVVLIAAAVWWVARRHWPPADRVVAFSADAHQPAFSADEVRLAVSREASHILDAALLEKVVLITMVSLCFAQVLPEVRATDLQLVVGVAFVVTVNTALSHWLARRGFGWAFTLAQFLVMIVVNACLFLAYMILRSRFDAPVSGLNAAFFVLFLALLVTLYDRYRQVYLMRFDLQG